MSPLVPPDGQILASGVDDGPVHLWDVADGTLLHTFEGHLADVTSVAFSPDGLTLASASDDGQILLWRVGGWEEEPANAPASIQVSLLPQETVLLANYPNPFNPETWIPYQLATPADVTLTIYNIQGRVVRDLDLGTSTCRDVSHSEPRGVLGWQKRTRRVGRKRCLFLYTHRRRFQLRRGNSSYGSRYALRIATDSGSEFPLTKAVAFYENEKIFYSYF